ncbi:heparinase II/III family protein, partial [Rhodobaculum claviforme]
MIPTAPAPDASAADRRAARRALRCAPSRGDAPPVPPGLEARSLTSPARGRALLQGRLRVGGAVMPAGGDDPWAGAPPAPVAEALQGFVWLDDLAAQGGAAAREVAQRWLAGWLDRFGTARTVGRGPAWRTDLAARRLIRWGHHGRMLASGTGRRTAAALSRCAHAHGAFLAARWAATPPGLARAEAATALSYAACTPDAAAGVAEAARAALEDLCERGIDAAGGLPQRNPEELLAVFMHLGWAGTALAAAGQAIPPGLAAAQARIAPTLRALRHADSGMARFHGGGAGIDGALDLALAEAEIRGRPRPGGAMGFARLTARRTTVIVDAAPPPPGPLGQASTLAFELTSGRRPVIAGPGPGAAFGPHWARAARATAMHATLTLEGWSSSRLGPARRDSGGPGGTLSDTPRQVTLTREGEGPTAGLVLSHDGWARSHGIVHVRQLTLSPDGRALWGEDALLATTPAQRRRFE